MITIISENKIKFTFNTNFSCYDIIQDGIKDLGYRLVNNKITGHDRWNVSYEIVLYNVKDNNYWRSYYSVGATEYQDETPWEYEECIFTKVYPIEYTAIKFEETNNEEEKDEKEKSNCKGSHTNNS